jgi:hypothetical protein
VLAARSARGSGTRRNSGIENTSHQTATLTNESLIAATALGSPNDAGIRIHSRLTTSRMPPPT